MFEQNPKVSTVSEQEYANMSISTRGSKYLKWLSVSSDKQPQLQYNHFDLSNMKETALCIPSACFQCCYEHHYIRFCFKVCLFT